MSAQTNRAGPGNRQRLASSAGLEAAGPACPRLVIEEVGVCVGRDGVEARAVLGAGPLRFRGIASGRSGAPGQSVWELSAAAAVAALQQYLQHYGASQPAPEIRLVDLATATTGIGQPVIHATLKLAHGSFEAYLLGSALVRNDWCSTAVAAVLDGTSRSLGRLARPEPEDREQQAAEVAEEDALLETAVPAAAAEQSASVDTGPASEAAPAEPAAAAPRIVSLPARGAEAPSPAAQGAPTLAIQMTATSIRAAAVAPEGRVLAESRRPARAMAEPGVNISLAVEAAHEALAGMNHFAGDIRRVGLALPGRLRVEEGVCVASGDFPSWREVAVGPPISEALGRPVAIIGSTEAAALAESRFGAGRDLSDVVFVCVGIDIDVAVIADGKPLFLSKAAPGHAGHMVIDADGPRCSCGEMGCWQALANRDALVARVLKAVRGGAPSAVTGAVDDHLGAITPALVCRLAANGDDVCRRALEETGRFLAVGLANLITLFDPQAIVLASNPALLGPSLLRAAEAKLKSSARSQLLSRCVLLSPVLGDAAPILGAAVWAGQNGG